MTTLKAIVKEIYRALRKTEEYILREYPIFGKKLPHDITFITSQELENLYPDLTPKEREHAIAKEYKAVFISQIGKTLRVLFEKEDHGYYVGHGDNYLLIKVQSDEQLIGQLKNVIIDSYDEMLIGRVV